MAIKKLPIQISAISPTSFVARNTKFCRKLDHVIFDVVSKFEAISIKIVHFTAIFLIYLVNWAISSDDTQLTTAFDERHVIS